MTEADWLELYEAALDARSRAYAPYSNYLVGAALDETAGYAKGPSAAGPVSNETIAAEFKSLAAAAPYFQPAHFLPTFETGLEILLAGIARARPANPELT